MSRRRAHQKGMTLVELLVAMTVTVLLSTLIIGSWITLTNAYSFNARSSKQRDVANLAIARMAREIRDAQKPAPTVNAFAQAYQYEVRFYSTFNEAGADNPSQPPRLTRFVLVDGGNGIGTIYRDEAVDSVFGNGDDVRTTLVKDVVNRRQSTDLFTYSAISDTTGTMYQSLGVTTLVPPAKIQTVRIVLFVDLNPGRSPSYMDISTTVEPRNMRHL